jgi:nicotinamide-nucleotide amidase
MITPEAAQLAQLLADRHWRVVLAESCTAGLASAMLAAVPGISQHLCGSWVTYRDECKQAWLGVPADMLRTQTAVSREVTATMALEALRRTETAHAAAAITGHLGPDAPAALDGICFLAVAARGGGQIQLLDQQRHGLVQAPRTERQHAASRYLLAYLSHVLGRSHDA